MCDFCHRHGEGKTWYLEARNYADDLMADLRRRDRMARFFINPERHGRNVERLRKVDKLPPFLRRFFVRRISKYAQKRHFGQVLPLEDVSRIFDFVTLIIRVACLCRHVTTGKEQRYCYGLSMAPDGGRLGKFILSLDQSYLTGPEGRGLERLDKASALAALSSHEKEGLCHTVWTFDTPFIGGICNCDRSDCLAMRATVGHGVPIFFRAEYVARSEPDRCHGCRECLRLCPFGALFYSAASRKVSVDAGRCYGCGICRSVCPAGAITLIDRRSVPAAARLW